MTAPKVDLVQLLPEEDRDLAEQFPEWVRLFGGGEEGTQSDALDLDQAWQNAQLRRGVAVLTQRMPGIMGELAHLAASAFWDGMHHERRRTGLPTDEDGQWDALSPDDRVRVRQFNTIVAGMPLQQRADLVDGLAAIISGHRFACHMGAEAEQVITRAGAEVNGRAP